MAELLTVQFASTLPYFTMTRTGLIAVVGASLLNMIGNCIITIKFNLILGLSSVILSGLMAMLCLIGIFIVNMVIIEIRMDNALRVSNHRMECNDLKITDQNSA